MVDSAIQIIPWYHNPSWWTAIGTIFLGLVALIVAFSQESVNKCFRSTKLNSGIRLKSPDCHYIELTDQNGARYPSYYVRVKITNEGKNVAKNIEIMINKCWQVKEDGTKEELKKFLPMNLVWSHYGEITMSQILPHHFRHCDIGSFRLIPNNKVIFKIDTAVQPNRVEGGEYPNILYAGNYQLDLIIGADNISTFQQSYKLSFDNNFYNTEEDMFTKNVKIEKV